MYLSGVGGLFGQTVVFKPSSGLFAAVMDVSGPPPSTPPAYVEVSRFPLPLSFSCATHHSIRLWFAAKKTACSCLFCFFSSEVLDLWPGLVRSPNCHHGLAFIGSRAKCLFSLHCWEGDGGYLGLPLSGASGMRAEEKLPCAHNRLASTPRTKTSQLEDLGFQPRLFFS